jgi:Swiss Army Knife protein, DSP-PTPase phosphatase domain
MRTHQLQRSGILITALALSLGIAGCAGCGPGGPLEVSWADTAGSCSELYNFSWVLEDQLAGMARPGTSHPLEEELAALQGCDIRLLVSLTTTPTPVDPAVAPDLELLHLPVADFTAPTQEQLQTFVQRAGAVIAGGHAVGVHCAAGKGRTGTFLAVYMVSQGMTADEAIAHIRALRPGSIETEAQEQAIKLYYKELTTSGDAAGE